MPHANHRVLIVRERSNHDVYLRVDRIPQPGEKVHIKESQIVPGGVVGNFAAQIAELGAEVSVIGSVTIMPGDDVDLDDLISRGVQVELDPATAGPGFNCYVLVSANGERSILIQPPHDLIHTVTGVKNALSRIKDNSVDLAYLGVWTTLQRINLSTLRAKSALFAVTLENADWPDDDGELILDYFDIVFCADETFDAHRAVLLKKQRQSGCMLVVTRGAAGSAMLVDSADWITEAAAVLDSPIVDTSGAGDCFAATFCFGYLNGLRGSELLRLANLHARKSIARQGGRPPLKN